MKKSFMIQAFESVGIKPWTNYIDYLLRAKWMGALDLDPFIEAYNKQKSKGRAMTPEEICDESGTPARIIIQHIAGQLWDMAYSESGMLMALNHVAIVRASVKEAKKPGGFRDREALLKANGVLPIPKTQSVHFHQHLTAGKTIEGEVVAAPGVLPDFEDDLQEMGGDLPPLLPAPEK